MPRKKPALEERIEHLNNLLNQGTASQRTEALRQALKDKNNFLVAKAAKGSMDNLCYELIPELHDAYRRFLNDPLKSDKTCAAKRALVRALYELDYDQTGFYREGLRYRQQEPAWGGAIDTAVEIRGTCALGLLAFGGPRAMIDLVDALHDPEPKVRSGVIKAMEMAQPYEAELVLRHTIRQGDPEPEVIGQAFSSLMKVAAETSLEFVSEYLDDTQESVREAAALALGESRLESALAILIMASQELSAADSFQSTLLNAIALQRHQAGYDYLFSVIEKASPGMAQRAVTALAIFNYNDELRETVRSLVEHRDEIRLRKAFEDNWL
jgi:HEAT repeat protein